MRFHSFRGKILCVLLFFSAINIITICTAVGIYYVGTEMRQHTDFAYSYARMAAEYIDGDKILTYAKSNEKDNYYEQIMDFLNCTQAQTNLLYYYVIVPCANDFVYIWDADNGEGTCALGHHEVYSATGKSTAIRAMEGNPNEEMIITEDKVSGYIGSVYYPIYNSQGESVALVGVDLSIPYIKTDLAHFMVVIITGVVMVILIFISILYLIFRKEFIKPIHDLNEAAKNMVSNLEQENEVDFHITTGDEIQELAASFRQMYREVKDYIQKLSNVTAERERIGAELDVAKKIQADMLPCVFPAFPDRDEFDIYATMAPAKEVGGDFYDFFFVDEDHLAIVIADVSGKGVPAALFMMISKMMIKSAAQSGLSPKEVLENINNKLCENNEQEMFVTVWLGILQISMGKMVCVNGGHEFPAIKRRENDFALIKDKHGFVLAGMENTRYEEYEVILEPGDMLFVYTDGVAEATDALNHLYGTDRMLAALNQEERTDCRKLLEIVHRDVDSFVGETPQFDDITMLALYFKGKN